MVLIFIHALILLHTTEAGKIYFTSKTIVIKIIVGYYSLCLCAHFIISKLTLNVEFFNMVKAVQLRWRRY